MSVTGTSDVAKERLALIKLRVAQGVSFEDIREELKGEGMGDSQAYAYVTKFRQDRAKQWNQERGALIARQCQRLNIAMEMALDRKRAFIDKQGTVHEVADPDLGAYVRLIAEQNKILDLYPHPANIVYAAKLMEFMGKVSELLIEQFGTEDAKVFLSKLHATHGVRPVMEVKAESKGDDEVSEVVDVTPKK